MATFNVDSLDFVDDEEIRTGANDDYAMRFDSTNSRLEVEDITNATVGYVPQNIGTDLVGGKFAETVSEGKALADDGNVYDSIQSAVNNATSWVKVGPGRFNESLTIGTAGLTLKGSGDRTILVGDDDTITVNANDCSVSDFSVEHQDGSNHGVVVTASNCTVSSVYVEGVRDGFDIKGVANNTIINNCTAINTKNGFNPRIETTQLIISNSVVKDSNSGINSGASDSIFVGNSISGASKNSIYSGRDDCLIGYNIVDGGNEAIKIGNSSTDNIIFNNRIRNTTNSAIKDNGTGTVLDANLTT